MQATFLRRLTCVLMFLVSLSALAQTARFSGVVTDQQGALIPSASVEVVNQDTLSKFAATTDKSGQYSIPYLAAGRYRIAVHASGFNTAISGDVNLDVGQAFLYNVRLTVGSAQSSVEVHASTITQVQTETAEVSGTITGREVAGLQLNGRNFSQLIALAPGVSNQTSQDEAKVGMAGSVSYSVNGGRTEYNAFLVDGSETLNVGINKDHTALIVTPSIDAIQEIKVLTSNYGAIYPSTGNGTTIVTTKSGSDQYHGNLYYFIRNEAFNAKGYFDVTSGAPLYRRNDFGGTIGGPLSIPHLYDARGRTHFFFSEEFRIEKSPTAYRQAVPSLAERNGDFSDVCPSYNGTPSGTFSRNQYPDCPSAGVAENGSPILFGGNHINGLQPSTALPEPPGRNAAAILGTGIIPFPNSTGGCNSTVGSCYNVDVSLPTYWREELFRIDHSFNEKTQLSFRYIHDEWNQTTPVPQYGFLQNSFPTIQNQFYGPGTDYVARLTRTLSSTLLNEFVASYTNSHLTLANRPGAGVTLQRPAALSAPCAPDPAEPQVGQCPITTIFDNGSAGTDGVAKLPGVSIAGNNAAYGGVGFNADTSYMPWEHSNPIYSFSDNVTKIVGKHNLQIGVQWTIYQRNQTNGPIGASTGETQGLLTYSNVKGLSSTGNAFADMLFHSSQKLAPGDPIDQTLLRDKVASFQQDSGQGRYRQRYQLIEPYIQDDFKVAQRLTINAGIRFSLFGTFHEIGNNAYNWVPSSFQSSVASSLAIDTSNTVTGGALLDSASGNPIRINQTNPALSADIGRITNGIVQCGANGVPSSCMAGHLFNPAPRVGLAWDVFGNGKMAIRAGYGMFYEHGTADEANTGSLEGSAPMVLDMTQNNPVSMSVIGQGNAFPINVTAIPTKAVWPYIQQWSVSVEHELPVKMLATFAYVGSKGIHLTAERQINQLRPLAGSNPFGPHEPLHYQGPDGFPNGDCVQSSSTGPGQLENGTTYTKSSPFYVNLAAACYGAPLSAFPDPNVYRPYFGLGQIFSLENIATSSYHAFQTTLRRTAGPLNLGLAYTYSHSLDDASDRSDSTFVNSYDIKSNRASSNFDQRHLLHISYIYELPLLRFFDVFLHSTDADPSNEAAGHPGANATWQARRVVRSMLGGWELSGITLFESGIPFTVVNGGSPNGVATLDNAGVANGTGSGSYPDWSGISPKSPKPAGGSNSRSVGPLLLNPAAFVAPRGLTFGTSGRNSLNNPRRWNTDLALAKRIALPYSTSLEFRAEAFNVFNTTQFRIYDPVLGNQAQNTASCYAQFGGYYSAAGGDGTDCLTGSSFLHPVDAHRPRTIQFGLKLGF